MESGIYCTHCYFDKYRSRENDCLCPICGHKMEEKLFDNLEKEDILHKLELFTKDECIKAIGNIEGEIHFIEGSLAEGIESAEAYHTWKKEIESLRQRRDIFQKILKQL
jgi:hypothetical protein